jgi:hypothetical protein
MRSMFFATLASGYSAMSGRRRRAAEPDRLVRLDVAEVLEGVAEAAAAPPSTSSRRA